MTKCNCNQINCHPPPMLPILRMQKIPRLPESIPRLSKLLTVKFVKRPVEKVLAGIGTTGTREKFIGAEDLDAGEETGKEAESLQFEHQFEAFSEQEYNNLTFSTGKIM